MKLFPFAPSAISALSRLGAAVVVTLAIACTNGCGNGLYAPCTSNLDCGGEQLRCVNLGGETGTCTRPCSISPERSGLPDVLDDDDFIGNNQVADAPSSPCNETSATATSQDNNVIAESEGAVGVCRVSDAYQATPYGDDSFVVGWCTPI